jgi:deoxyribodipyrimidine photolyase-related protein
MVGDETPGGRWNFDCENCHRARGDVHFPSPLHFAAGAQTQEAPALAERHFGDHCGALCPFNFAVIHEQALAAPARYVSADLPGFGATEDAMLTRAPFLHHTALSPYLHVGLLDPREIRAAADSAYLAGHAPLDAVERFI